MNFNDFETQNEITMTVEEEKRHKNLFSKICLAFIVYITLTQALGILVSYLYPELLESETTYLIVSSAIQYLLAFPIFYWIIKKLPAQSPVKAKLTTREFIRFTSVTIFMMYIGNYVSQMIMATIEENFGAMPENSLDSILTENNYLVTAILVGIIAPIIEEFIFRKLLIDRLTPYGEKISVFFSALLFGLLHGNLYQFFYAFLIGIVLSAIYVKTGKIIYTISIHCFINLFFGVFTSYVISLLDIEQLMEYAYEGIIPEEYILANSTPLTLYGIYSVVFYALLIMGIFNFSRQLLSLRFNKGTVLFPKGKTLEIIFFNAGAVILISICLALMAFSTFSFAIT